MRFVLTALCLFTSTAHAVPAQFTHQGRLLDSEGAPLEDEATITFRVTDSETGGTALWEEDITVLAKSVGKFGIAAERKCVLGEGQVAAEWHVADAEITE